MESDIRKYSRKLLACVPGKPTTSSQPQPSLYTHRSYTSKIIPTRERGTGIAMPDSEHSPAQIPRVTGGIPV
jgi:hypothetical protein